MNISALQAFSNTSLSFSSVEYYEAPIHGNLNCLPFNASTYLPYVFIYIYF